MATVRQYDGDNAIERWRHCDDTTATVRYDYRIVAPAYQLYMESLLSEQQDWYWPGVADQIREEGYIALLMSVGRSVGRYVGRSDHETSRVD
ncbi:hypothetical protein DPMN_172224 [Dreissena polymorpha]|uniref:Uncharacterized protein n=1 Tax=Dreissena polymorpha TaxID=45954 RepID=A0A9D4E2Q3_DREPO|nr:hypothetical protein DPMN_172224 [Dreissena polymorpha]